MRYTDYSNRFPEREQKDCVKRYAFYRGEKILKVLKSLLISLFCMGMLNFAFAETPTNTKSDFSPSQQEAIKQIVHSYLIQNPEVLIEASQILEKKAQAKQEAAASSVIEEKAQDFFNTSSSPVIGNAKAPVTIVEFLDYQCGHCKHMHPLVRKVVESNGNTVKVIFKELPIFGGASETAAKAALAAIKQNKFMPLHNALFTEQEPLTEKRIFELAAKNGLNVDQLKKDMASSEIQDEIKNNFELAKVLQLSGTPSFIIANVGKKQFRFIPGATTEENLNALVKQLQ